MTLMKILAVVLMAQLAATQEGTECTTSSCTAKRGYFTYEIGTPLYDRIILNNQYTTFVVIIKDVETVTEAAWGTLTAIHSAGQSSPKQLNRENRIFFFNNTRQVRILVQSLNVIRFRVEYYVGCNVVEGRNISISKESSTPSTTVPPSTNPICAGLVQRINQHYFLYLSQQPIATQISALTSPSVFNSWFIRQPFYLQYITCNSQSNQNAATISEPTCWLIIPTIAEEIRTVRSSLFGIAEETTEQRYVNVEETYLAIENATTNENTTVKVTDLISGNKTVMSLEINQSFAIDTLSKNNSTYFVYENSDGQRQITTLLLVDLVCQRPEDCNDAQFSLLSYALQQSDIDCIERENKCKFNIGTKNFTCNNTESLFFSFLNTSDILLSSTEDAFDNSCPAFQLFFSAIGDSVNKEIDSEFEDSRRGGTPLNECPNYKKFCKKSCYEFKTKRCKKMCYFLTVNARLCSHVHNVFA